MLFRSNGFLTLKAKQAIEEADLVAGFQTVLNVILPFAKKAELCPMAYRDQEEVLDYAVGKVKEGKSLVVCAWGDLNVSARELLARVRRRAGKVELTPGISSIQMACARAEISLEDAVFITLHQRRGASDDFASDVEEVVHFLKDGRRHVILLPRPYDFMPPGIAKELVSAGIAGDRPVTVFQRLTLDGEKRWDGNLDECGEITEEFSDLSIMVIFTGTGEGPDSHE